MSLLKSIPKCIDFPEAKRSEITFSDVDKVRLDPATRLIGLKLQTDDTYPTDNDLYIMSYQFYPKANKGWTAFQAELTTPTGTSVSYRLWDGTDQRYWDGGAWSIAGASDWNTESEIATNISAFPIGPLKIVVNLKTTDNSVTPTVQYFLIGYQAETCFLDDWIHRTLVPYFQDNIRPWARWIIAQETTGTSVDLNAYNLDSAFDVVDVARVYNHSDDPSHSTDLLDSYNPATKIITLASSVDAGKNLWVEFIYSPEVAVSTSSDYKELRKVPAIVLENIRVIDKQRFYTYNSIVEKETGDLIVYPPPWSIKLGVDVMLLAPTSVDGLRLSEAVHSYIEANEQIQTYATDEPYDISIIEPWARADTTEFSDLQTLRMSLEICNLQAWLLPAQTGLKAVKSFKTTGDVNIVI